jgi:CxxC motif-containing protein
MADELVCITCPLGCRLSVEKMGETDLRVTGNRCARGEAYAREEYLSPKRVVTATCSAVGQGAHRIPCRTTAAFPKERIPELLAAVYALKVEKPVKRGDILLGNVLGEGMDLIVTRTME